ncbi:MAG: hypothetical protein A3G33_10950 [Omnitrophica bacterium RIFCSPLOWO2_12_FULL_44_17]|uniref:tRNA/rRNA methyltransferase SpoU type domain-containing protein n=1 Tax=Candidatus Danuiimicrobium aquiferis TaxID=1801832 RepID=A0A1G1KSZ1_9BACT|nr:MAG: hypothetical protein A3B72_01130 [Omnitrophica bacterium RIFCSPHIGHO2_02_FULL_45_28]OGW88808.1 MAG: hypothetical protein A3E74_04495 [Omnitrophica bacterium RIFCSPHIGHO2_12_FULL_44_12]OGW96016.1 MAG: hypothetical protein A3G33_10950 [Omnitrophica bacterium RIFCSPLOWO2_12_FULL_44_17]OGX03069.1 MAG: hypothetical protein A3J12_08575 [Omnitrophica bacterium RIFCSPLOWO2_02_FULL_44_11]
MQKLTHKELVERQYHLRQSAAKLPLVVVLNNIRSLYNVGSIFRTADGVGIEKLWLCGITGHPPKPGISKTALGAENAVEWEHSWDILRVVRSYKEAGYRIVFLEQIKQSVSYQEFKPNGPVCLVLGNEISGISDELLSLCDHAIEIEMDGLKNSLNVTVAFGVVAYYIRNRLKRKSQK